MERTFCTDDTGAGLPTVHEDVSTKESPTDNVGPAATNQHQEPIDLVGAPFAVIESDPGVFTSLTRRLGIQGLEVVELYDIEPYAVEHLSPRGLIFCFLWQKDVHRARDFKDPAAERVWFANQLSGDACASLAMLNIVFNCPEVDIGDTLTVFRQETEKMSPVMKGLAISSSQFIREAHRSLARPQDLRAALNALAMTTLVKAEAQLDASTKPGTAAKRSSKAATRTSAKPGPKPKVKNEDAAVPGDIYHFIGYVPAYGKVWELDGLKSGPLEVGELASREQDANTKTINWMDVVRPAIRSKMRKYGGAEEGDNIRFCLLALVDSIYQKASDEFEWLKRERVSIQRRMPAGWESQVDSELLRQARTCFDYSAGSPGAGRTYAMDFGARRMARDVEILNMSQQGLLEAWDQCINDAAKARISLEDEVMKAKRENTEHMKRTHDYEPFMNEFIASLEKEGLLEALFDGDVGGKKKGKRAKVQ
ncbi:cysteine proteinase [Mycena crocata]|nr:cysteine proteinase [Mycena crocata]